MATPIKYRVSVVINHLGMKVSANVTKDDIKEWARSGGVKVTSSYYAAVLGVRRPGKTAKDKESGHIPYRKNRRVWTGRGKDDPAGEWVKVDG